MSKYMPGLLRYGERNPNPDEPPEISIFGTSPIGNAYCVAVATPCGHGNANRDLMPDLTEANAQRIIACWNACAGIEDPLDLRKQRDELVDVLKPFADIKADDGDDFSSWYDNVIIRCEVTAGEIKAARAALSRLSKEGDEK